MISGSVLNPYWLIAAWVHVCVDFLIPLSTGSLCQFSERCLLAVGTLQGKSRWEKAQCKCQPLTQLSLCNLPHNAPRCASSIIAWGEGGGADEVLSCVPIPVSLTGKRSVGAAEVPGKERQKYCAQSEGKKVGGEKGSMDWRCSVRDGGQLRWPLRLPLLEREAAGGPTPLERRRNKNQWRLTDFLICHFHFFLLAPRGFIQKAEKRRRRKKQTLHRPPSHDYLPSSPPLSLSSRPSSSLMTELLAGDMKAAFSPPLVSTWNGGEGRQALENVKLDSGLISDGILPRFTTFIPLPQHSPLRYFCPPISTCETFIKKLTLGSGPCRPCCPPGADDDTSLTTACQYAFHISFGAEGNHPRQCVRIFTLQSLNPVEASFHSRSRAPQMCSEDVQDSSLHLEIQL